MTRQYLELDDPHDSGRRWRIDSEFLTSNWECIWGKGCEGIGTELAAELGHGCCSLGAEMFDPDEARLTVALAAMLDPQRFQFHAVANSGGVLDEVNGNTRVVDGACIFLNRAGFAGGAGCALHLGAIEAAEPPSDWKPSVCWQLPIKIDWEITAKGSGQEEQEVATLRRWERRDWGDEGKDMAWLCTERTQPDDTALDDTALDDTAPDPPVASAYVGERPVIESLAHELGELLGQDLFRIVQVTLQNRPPKNSRDT